MKTTISHELAFDAAREDQQNGKSFGCNYPKEQQADHLPSARRHPYAADRPAESGWCYGPCNCKCHVDTYMQNLADHLGIDVRHLEPERTERGKARTVGVASSGPVPLSKILKHMDKHYTNDQLKSDLDAVLSVCASPEDQEEIRKFARAKLKGKAYEGEVDLKSKTCEQCGKSFTPKRSTARFCSPVCRQRHGRRN